MKLDVGYSLPPWSFVMDTTSIVAGAISTRDYYPLHHDRDAAQAKGLRDIILNSPSVDAYLVRYVTDALGPFISVIGMRYRLQMPICAKDEVVFTGSVSDKIDDFTAEFTSPYSRIEVEVRHAEGLAVAASILVR